MHIQTISKVRRGRIGADAITVTLPDGSTEKRNPPIEFKTIRFDDGDELPIIVGALVDECKSELASIKAVVEDAIDRLRFAEVTGEDSPIDVLSPILAEAGITAAEDVKTWKAAVTRAMSGAALFGMTDKGEVLRMMLKNRK